LSVAPDVIKLEQGGRVLVARDFFVVQQHKKGHRCVDVGDGISAAIPDYVYQAENRELVGTRRIESQGTPGPALQNTPRKEGRMSADDLQWQGNSMDMVDKAVAGAPFFVRRLVRRSLMDAVIERADSSGRVTEDAVIDAVRATTPEKMRDKVLADLEQMKSR